MTAPSSAQCESGKKLWAGCGRGSRLTLRTRAGRAFKVALVVFALHGGSSVGRGELYLCDMEAAGCVANCTHAYTNMLGGRRGRRLAQARLGRREAARGQARMVDRCLVAQRYHVLVRGGCGSAVSFPTVLGSFMQGKCSQLASPLAAAAAPPEGKFKLFNKTQAVPQFLISFCSLPSCCSGLFSSYPLSSRPGTRHRAPRVLIFTSHFNPRSHALLPIVQSCHFY